jgi:hypothetical protein
VSAVRQDQPRGGGGAHGGDAAVVITRAARRGQPRAPGRERDTLPRGREKKWRRLGAAALGAFKRARLATRCTGSAESRPLPVPVPLVPVAVACTADVPHWQCGGKRAVFPRQTAAVGFLTSCLCSASTATRGRSRTVGGLFSHSHAGNSISNGQEG